MTAAQLRTSAVTLNPTAAAKLTVQVKHAEDLQTSTGGEQIASRRSWDQTHSRQCVARERNQVANDAVLEQELPHARAMVPAHEPNDVEDEYDEVEAHG